MTGGDALVRADSVATPQTNAAPLVLFTSETPSDKKGRRDEDDPFAAAFNVLEDNKKEDTFPAPQFDLFSAQRSSESSAAPGAGAASWFSMAAAGATAGVPAESPVERMMKR